MKKLTFLSALAIASFVATTAFAGLLDKDVDYSTLPLVVQNAITTNAEGGEIKSIEERLLKKDGLKIYEVEVKKADGTEIEFEVNEAGELIELERE